MEPEELTEGEIKRLKSLRWDVPEKDHWYERHDRYEHDKDYALMRRGLVYTEPWVSDHRLSKLTEYGESVLEQIEVAAKAAKGEPN